MSYSLVKGDIVNIIDGRGTTKMSYSLVKGDIVNIINDDGHFKAVIPSPHFAPCVRLSPSPPITRGNNIVWAIVLSPFRPSSDLSVRVELRSYWAMTETNC